MKPIVMTSKAAIELVAKTHGIDSLYALARLLSGDGLEIQPIQVSNWRKGKKMSKRAAKRFLDLFDITIHPDSVHNKGVFSRVTK